MRVSLVRQIFLTKEQADAAGEIQRRLAEKLGIDAGALAIRDRELSVATTVEPLQYAVRLQLEVNLPKQRDFAGFERGLTAMETARACLASAAHDAGLDYIKVIGEDTRHSLSLELEVPPEVLDQLQTAQTARYLIAAAAKQDAASIEVDCKERGLTITTDAKAFTSVVRAFFAHYLPDRLPQPPPRVTTVNGAVKLVPLATRRRPWALRLSASLLLALGLLSWLVPATAVWLSVAGVWWLSAIAVALLMGRDWRGSIASVAGAASTFLGVMALFAIAYGVIWQISPHEIGLTWIGQKSTPSLGEMFLLSLGLAVSAGTLDVALQGTARFVAFVELLTFFGTVAAVIGAFGRRWLFDRDARITGRTLVTGLDDDGPASP